MSNTAVVLFLVVDLLLAVVSAFACIYVVVDFICRDWASHREEERRSSKEWRRLHRDLMRRR